ncbi:hypothetical protein BSKO_01213 [Bryopsis sp. KO-2023]|nr:hypothetical protein BSKO_01213 [Bryopsis sp. KO-2023]
MDITDVFSRSHVVEENVMSYSLHDCSNGEISLDELRNRCLACIGQHVVDYVWQREPFVLHSSLDATPPWEELGKCGQCLWGSVRFGESVEDEWFIVSLLQRMTKYIPNLAAKVWDNDGEFLLIEAAFHIPKWLKPDDSNNRVWIFNGALHLVSKKKMGKKGGGGALTVSEALHEIKAGGTEAKEKVQRCVWERTECYSEGGASNLHWARCRLPATVAAVLKFSPQLVSPAIHSFIHRDQEDMKIVSKLAKFPCKELATVMVKLHRCSYAQLAQHEFGPPKGYRMLDREDKGFKACDIGLKIACGMEILYHRSAAHTEREEKHDDQLDVMPGWEDFLGSLKRNGYFGENIPGSMRHRELLSKASASFLSCSGHQSKINQLASTAMAIDNILKDSDGVGALFPKEDLFAEDDDSWLYMGQSDLDIELNKRQKELHKETQQGDPLSEQDAFDPEQLVDGFKSFVDKLSSHEGAEVPEENFGDINFDTSRFVSELRGALGIIPNTTDQSENPGSSSEGDSEGFSERMDGAMDHSSEHWEAETATDSDDDSVDSEEFNQAYSVAMNEELSGSKLDSSFAVDPHESQPTTSSAAEDTNDGLTPVDVNINLVRGLLESYSSQNGMAGPAGNLLGMMDMKLPGHSETRSPES